MVALFDTWVKFGYYKEVNGVGSFELTIALPDARNLKFELDGIVQLYRKVPGCSVDWYSEFMGFHRRIFDSVDEKGVQLFTSSGVGFNDLLARTIINYPPDTIKAYKDAPAETAMKEYAEENCGASATVANGRESSGVLPDFQVETDTASGADWEGDRAWQNLLDVEQEIARFADIDFAVNWDDSSKKFKFQTYVDQYGEDRTITGIDPATGKNSAGNYPVIFSLERGNLRSINRNFNRISESNVVVVTGDGDGATVDVEVRSAATTTDSPWNRREVCRPQAGFVSEMQIYGDGELADLAAKDILTFSPLSQSSCLYGKHYFLGDKVSVLFRGTYFSMRVFGVRNNVSDKTEDLSITFSELQ
jgi:hypothetical protein